MQLCNAVYTYSGLHSHVAMSRGDYEHFWILPWTGSPQIVDQACAYTGLLVCVTHVNNMCVVACRYLFIIDCTLNLMVFYGIMGVYVTADLSLANVLSSFFYGLWNLFTGFLIGVSQMAGWWKWL